MNPTPLHATIPSVAAPVSNTSKFYPTFFLGIFLGMFGVHRFYVLKIGTGILQLFTLGGLGFWWLLDIIIILRGKFKDKNGVLIPNINPKMSMSIFVIYLSIIALTIPNNSTPSGSTAANKVTADTNSNTNSDDAFGAGLNYGSVVGMLAYNEGDVYPTDDEMDAEARQVTANIQFDEPGERQEWIAGYKIGFKSGWDSMKKN